MAKATPEMVDALRKAAKRVAIKTNYNWKDIGACNCGNLAQVITSQTKKDIFREGIKKHGDWEMLARKYQHDSVFGIDKIISNMLSTGMILDDFKNLENLSDHRVLSRLPEEKRGLIKRDKREDVILYMNTWAEILEEELCDHISLPENLIKEETSVIKEGVLPEEVYV